MGIFPVLSQPANQQNYDLYVDLGFAVVFLITIIVLLATSCKTFKRKSARDFYSVSTTLFVMMTLIGKLDFNQ